MGFGVEGLAAGASTGSCSDEASFKAHRLLYHSTLGLRVIKKKKKACSTEGGGRGRGSACSSIQMVKKGG